MTSSQEYAIDATRRYLQNVVFVDDEIYDRSTGKPATIVVEDIPEFPIPFKKKKKEEVAAEAEPEKTQAIFHPRQLVDSFANIGVVCALYEPEEKFKTDADSLLFKLCERADVVILDWELFEAGGENILPLIESLAQNSQQAYPHHSRLCVIYTGTPDLIKVNGRIFDYLTGKGLNCDKDPSPTTLNSGSMKIVVLGKPNTTGRSEEQKNLEIQETDLPERIIKEFSEMHTGIFPLYALNGLAAVRRNSKRILDKFHRDLDEVFLLHRALNIPQEEAFEQLPELLAEEMLAVLTESQPDEETITQIVQNITNTLTFTEPPLDNKNVAEGTQLVKDFLVGGPEAIPQRIKSNHLISIHKAMGCETSKADSKLAALYNLRTNYASFPPQLTFGTIVRRKVGEADFEYAVCLMPLCDSVRLTEAVPIKFPFWALAKCEPNSKGKGIVVPIDQSSYELLYMSGKPRDNLWLEGFTASHNKIVEAMEANGVWTFNSEDGNYEWVAQLKPAHSQRIAHDVGTSLSRVGVLEAEWLRLRLSN